MPGIPLKHAIESQNLYKCLTGDDPPIDFRIRFLSLEKLNIKKLDDSDKVDRVYDLSQGEFLIVRFELISLYKEVIDARRIHEDFLIADQDGFHYKSSLDYHLTSDSKLSAKYEFYPFIRADLVPKIKYKGAIPFYVPKEDHAEYSFTVYKGSAHEI